MRALLLRETTGPSALTIEDVPEPEASEGMVLIDVHAAGAGFVDMLVTKGEYQIKPPLPFVPGIELAGTVRSAPQDSGLSVGQRVAATTAVGAFAEVAAAPAFLTHPIPDEVSFETAAAMVINYQTAHLGLKRRGRLAVGETVLVHGAAGGTGAAAIGVALALGAGRVIAVASSAEKRAVALTAGATDAVEGEGDWIAAVRELTGGRGADVVWDPVGGDAFAGSLKCMAPEGRLLVVGFASGEIPQLGVNRLLLRHLDVIGVNYGGMLPVDPSFVAIAAEELFGWVADGTLPAPVVNTHQLEDAAAGLQGFADRTAVGKPVFLLR
jgi:NADPH2:quinone reductase